jgi:hypothetical protein
MLRKTIIPFAPNPADLKLLHHAQRAQDLHIDRPAAPQ